ncbi:MAG TPA: hypothetical protein VF921_15560 [Vicinamibacterales bacterium]
MTVVCMLAGLAAGPADFVSARQVRPAGERPPGLTVDFAAVQADGTPVADLQSSEVEVRVNDKVRVIRSLRRVSTGSVSTAPGAIRVAPPYGTNDNVTVGRHFVLLVDQESFAAGGQQLLIDAVEGLLPQLTPADQAMVVALPYGGVKVPFTSDTMRIRLAMAAVTSQGSRNETGSELACRTARFLESLEAFLQAQPGRGSPLTVVLFTAGLAAPRRDAPMALAPGMCELLVNQFRRITTVASLARANVYLMQPADIGMTGARTRESIAGVGFLGSDNPLEGIESLAGVTGAARLPLDATGTGSLLRVARETSAYYEAELEPERGEIFGRTRSLGVKVARRGVTVRARPEITFIETPRAGTRLAVSDLLGATDPLTDVRLRVGGFTVREGDGKLRVGVLVEPVDPAATLASVAAILIAGDDRIVGRWFSKDASERPLLGAMAAPPGTYRLRVVALDTAGRPGAAEEVIEAGLTTVGPLSLGSLMLGVSRPDGMKPQLEFSSEPTAIASFDIYGGAAGLRMSATLEVARDLDGPALVTMPLALKRADEGRVVATGAAPVGALPPGDYVVRGIIRLEDGTTGRVTRTLRKKAR